MRQFLQWYAPNAFDDGLHKCNLLGLNLVSTSKVIQMLDLGCGDGSLTCRFAKEVNAKEIWSIEYKDENIRLAEAKGIHCIKADLNRVWPVEDNRFDFILSSQSIEHMHNTRMYIHECYRCLKKGGTLLILTENLASWINIGALVLGWQPFSTTNIDGISIGNRLMWHTEVGKAKTSTLNYYSKYTKEAVTGVHSHIRVLAYQGLFDILHSVGFKNVSLKSTGYLPFWGTFSDLLCTLDPRHGHFLIAVATK